MTVQNRALASAFTQRAIFWSWGAVFVWHSVADRGARSLPAGSRPADLEPRSGPARWTRPADRRTDRHRPRSTDRRSPRSATTQHTRTRSRTPERRGSRTSSDCTRPEDRGPRITRPGRKPDTPRSITWTTPGHDQGTTRARPGQRIRGAAARRACLVSQDLRDRAIDRASKVCSCSAVPDRERNSGGPRTLARGPASPDRHARAHAGRRSERRAIQHTALEVRSDTNSPRRPRRSPARGAARAPPKRKRPAHGGPFPDRRATDLEVLETLPIKPVGDDLNRKPRIGECH